MIKNTEKMALKELWQFASQMETINPAYADQLKKDYYKRFRALKTKKYSEIH